MSKPILILRPQPGASETAERAGAIGLDALVAPIFEIEPIQWQAPDASEFAAILFTSANAPRFGGAELKLFLDLPCYAVGESTAAAAGKAGFRNIRTGPSDGAALVEMMVHDGIPAAFHASGRDHVALEHQDIRIERRAVYASNAVAFLPPEAVMALGKDTLALLHSPRAASHFAALVEAAGLSKQRTGLAAISKAAAVAAGEGWKSIAVSPEPRDHALLELAAKLCKTGPPRMGSDE